MAKLNTFFFTLSRYISAPKEYSHYMDYARAVKRCSSYVEILTDTKILRLMLGYYYKKQTISGLDRMSAKRLSFGRSGSK